MVLNGIKIKVINPVQSGVSRIGNPWRRQEVVLEWNESCISKNGSEFVRTCNILATLLGNRIDEFAQVNPKVGDTIEADFDFNISSGKFMNNEIYMSDVKIVG